MIISRNIGNFIPVFKDENLVKSTGKNPNFNEFLNIFLLIQMLRYFFGIQAGIQTGTTSIFQIGIPNISIFLRF